MSDIYTDPPQSRNEAIIKSTIDGTQYTDPPQSRMEDLLLDLKEAIEGGGGGGTTVVANPEGEATDDLEKLQVGSDIYGISKDYEEMDNKPQINGETLSGNKTASELGLQEELDGAQTVEGNPITVTDAEAMNAESVVVELEPKQDLHGYDAPWVGGAGKNLYNKDDTNGHPGEVLEVSDGSLTSNYYFTSSDYISMTAGEDVVLSASNNNNVICAYNASKNFISGTSNYVEGTNIPLVFTLPTNTAFVRVSYETNVIDTAQLERGSTATTFAPYSNICPITGYSEVNVERVGKNLFDNNQTFPFDGYISSDGTLTSSFAWRTTDYQLIKSGTYALSGALDESGYYGICWYDENKNFIDGFQRFTIESVSVNIPNNAKYIRYSVNIEAFNTFQLELGNQATTYEPYQGNTYTIDLDGTKYGGTLDVTEGGYSDIKENVTGWVEYASGNGFKAYKLENLPPRNKAITDIFDLKSNCIGEYGTFASADMTKNIIQPPYIGNPTTAYMALNENVSPNSVQFMYDRDTPSSISTIPTPISLLDGMNNVSTNGINITLKYQPNNVIGECKQYTDEQIEKVLPSLPTTEGTYHLSCEVTSGVGVLSWVSDS